MHFFQINKMPFMSECQLLKEAEIISGYKKAFNIGVKDVFPEVELKRCFFHLAQNMHKYLSALGLISECNRNADFALKAKMAVALAFVPINKIDENINTLGIELLNELQELLNWFRDTYVG